jgi:dTDP-4-dehydrorhamnose reductase
METRYQYPCLPELWGGMECTINRVENVFRDQLLYTGHYGRKDDLEAFSGLGIRKMRYPVLWDRHMSTEEAEIDWTWTGSQLECLRNLNIEPIAGLLHHGSGPAFTSLIDDDFPYQLAAYAKKVATQFPWINYYTPVNEPLTTARFSGLYGIWYPHHKNELSFVKMLLNQVKGIILSMKAIREINPNAQLVTTEDISKIHSTPLLSYQALFENKRRWLTYDLLCGKVTPKHFFWNHFLKLGIPVAELAFILENNCCPDIMGFNYYVTSERYLDQNIEQYPADSWGGNGIHRYADVAAVRATKPDGLANLLKEAWTRYELPIAITECHLNCSREEQLRWFKETWDSCIKLRTEGLNIKAVTAWALLGAYDWDSLLMHTNNFYESGVFDVRNKARRPTALAKLVRSLGTTGDYEHPVLQEKGWWNKMSLVVNNSKEKVPLLIAGKNGTLGKAFMNSCQQRSIPYIGLGRNELDISKENEIASAIERFKPWAIVNTAGFVNVDEAELREEECFAVNATGPGLLAKACYEKGIQFMTFSSDLVFDGAKDSPYNESDRISPINVYGESKAHGEIHSLSANPDSLIIRTSSFFGPIDKFNFAYHILQSLRNSVVVDVANNVIVSPTYVPDMVGAALDLLIDEEDGVWHLSNEGHLTWADFATEIAGRAGYKIPNINFRPCNEMGWKARRPLNSALQSQKGIQLPKLDNALNRFFEQHAF